MMDDFNDSVDAKLVSRMRAVNPEQFHTIVRMHLSFELELNTEDNDCTTEKAKLKRWGILCFSKKPKSTINLQKGMEGAALTDEGISQVKHLVDYLSKEQCITQEGIFRRTGALTRQQELKTSLYQGSPLNLEDAQYNVHDCASVLKNYLAELPEPLLTDLHYPAHCQIAELTSSEEPTANEKRLLRVLQLLLLLLPTPNRILLKHIIDLLNKTASFESNNKMNCDTLATLFTPHLMCPRKLSPEALHVNSQNLSGLVAFMIRKGLELFDIPEKLGVEVRAYWMNQERKMMSPHKFDTNESTSDATSTAHTVFSFVDHKLTAEATAKEDTQVALAQLYATIQSMPESTKKRRLIKQLNKESIQMTPRSSVKNFKTKSLGDSIKKHIFQKKLLGSSKKIGEVKANRNGLSRSSSEENVFTTNLNKLHASSQCSKSVDELDAQDSFEDDCNLLAVKPMSNSTGSIDAPFLGKTKFMIKRLVTQATSPAKSSRESTPKKQQQVLNKEQSFSGDDQLSHLSQSLTQVERTARANFIRQNEEMRKADPVDEIATPPATHTSTPSDLLRRAINLGEHHMFTPIIKDKSMSPITQSATKMPKAMQETMMTPRSRNPIMMISGSNICDLASTSSKLKFEQRKKCQSIVEEKSPWSGSYESLVNDKENELAGSRDYLYESYGPKSREYALSRSVLSASPVDLSFSSRTDDYEQSETESKAESDTSGVVSGGSGSPDESPDRAILSPRKRTTSLQRNDCKVMVESKCKQLSESNLQAKIKDGHVTSF